MNKHDYYKNLLKDYQPCKAGTVQFTEETDEELMDKYVEFADYSLELGVPNNGQIIRNFTGEQLTSKNIYITEELDKTSPQGRHILGGDLYHQAVFEKFNVGDLYVKDNAILDLTVTDNSIVYVFAYDSCTININKDESARVYVYRFNEAVTIDGEHTLRDRVYE